MILGIGKLIKSLLEAKADWDEGVVLTQGNYFVDYLISGIEDSVNFGVWDIRYTDRYSGLEDYLKNSPHGIEQWKEQLDSPLPREEDEYISVPSEMSLREFIVMTIDHKIPLETKIKIGNLSDPSEIIYSENSNILNIN